MKQVWASLGGHYWTLAPFFDRELLARRRALAAPHALPWTIEVPDPDLGSVRLTGRLHAPPGAERCILLIHGLGGNCLSSYLGGVVLAAWAHPIACLCINLRGADGLGEDFYHAALTADLHAALASPELAPYRDLYVVGFSLGGHLALRLATEAHDARLRAVAAICAPLDLQRSQAALDARRRLAYRQYVLRRLKASYVAVAARRALRIPLDRVLRVNEIWEWDELTVVPRFGFGNPAEYYRRASVAPQLGSLRVPALLVQTENDPMVTAASVRPALGAALPLLDVRWLERGGHVGFPGALDLGEAAPLGLAPQVLSWLTAHAPGACTPP
jgi:predicted alpha/beta-fold hydrolase